MKNLLKWRKPSPAMIVAIAALSVSLAGTAIAGPIAEISGLGKKDKRTVRKISRNISNKVSDRKITQRAPGLSVAAAQNAIAAETAKAADTAKTAETAKTADSAKTAETVSDGAISTGKLANGAVTQPKVGANAIGAAQFKNVIVRTGEVVVPNGGSEFASANCQTGEQIISAGSHWNAFEADLYTNYIRILGNGAQGRGNNFSGASKTFFVDAYCLPI